MSGATARAFQNGAIYHSLVNVRPGQSRNLTIDRAAAATTRATAWRLHDCPQAGKSHADP
jgi:hypothetical protein